jgi:hypothetical protein
MYNGAYLFEDSTVDLVEEGKEDIKINLSIKNMLDLPQWSRKSLRIAYKGMVNEFALEESEEVPQHNYMISLVNQKDCAFASGSKLIAYRNDGSELLPIEYIHEHIGGTYISYMTYRRITGESGGIDIAYLAISGIKRSLNDYNRKAYRVWFPMKAGSTLFIANGGFIVKGERADL